jgi:alkanesulfonate monooxygenase SsuD/methylene tetrahydromethanopterin reductase-like flavin-dependent oxidoreductase (luciferase family)
MSFHPGIGLFTGQVPLDSGRTVAQEYDDTLAIARLCDDNGFESFWVSEHHNAEDSYLPSMPVMLAAIAAVTKNLRLGTAIALGPFQHPIRFAEDCAVVDQLARGRLMLGIGAGWREEEFRSFNIPITERFGRTTELVKICRAAWDNDRFSHEGKYYTFTDVSVTPKPFGHLPLLLGGTAPKALARAGRIGDGYIGTPRDSLDLYKGHVAGFDAGAREAGRDPEAMPIGFHMNAWVSRNGKVSDTALKSMWHQIGTYAMWHAQEHGDHSGLLPPMDEKLLRERAFLGTPDEVIAQARPWIEAFPNRELHVIFRLQYPGMELAEAEDAIGLFADEVIPRLKNI